MKKQLQALSPETDGQRILREAMDHAEHCLFAAEGWTVETLGHNIETSFGNELDADTCDDIAREAMRK